MPSTPPVRLTGWEVPEKIPRWLYRDGLWLLVILVVPIDCAWSSFQAGTPSLGRWSTSVHVMRSGDVACPQEILPGILIRLALNFKSFLVQGAHTPVNMVRVELVVQVVETSNWIIHRSTGVLISICLLASHASLADLLDRRHGHTFIHPAGARK